MRAVTSWIAAGLLLLPGLVAAQAPAGTQPPVTEEPPRPETGYSEVIEVNVRTLAVRAVDAGGNPILGLGPEDFRVESRKRPVEVLGVEWVGPELGIPPPPPPPEAAEGGAEAGGGVGAGFEEEWSWTPQEPGRLVVFFVQADLDPSRITGQMQVRPYTRELLASLYPEDRVAVVSFDSHLKLWQDFDTDLAATHRAIDVAVRYSPEIEVEPARPYSLALHLDAEAALRAATAERALEVVARALEPLPGEKTMIFLGWGLGRYGADGIKMRPEFGPAIRALRDARVTVFVLDITAADSHSLGFGLEQVAEITGGLYLSTFRMPVVATRTLARAIAGYYVLTFDASDVAGREDELRVRLRGRSGRVLLLSGESAAAAR
jgi:VWFA-related protein